MKPSITIAIDFDGVIQHHPGTGYTDLTTPIPGARDFVRWAKSKGFHVILHTARFSGSSPEDREWIKIRDGIGDWLCANGFPAMEITGVKPPAHLYIDDRGIRFEGPKSWDVIRELLKERVDPGRWEHAKR